MLIRLGRAGSQSRIVTEQDDVEEWFEVAT